MLARILSLVHFPHKDLGGSRPRSDLPSFLSFSVADQAHFAKRLSFLLRSGITLHESLTLLCAHMRSKRKALILRDVTERVREGAFLSTSLARFPRLFDPLTITIIRVGEHTGSLSENLAHLAHELQKRHMLRQKIRGALVYPFFVIIATVGVTGMLIMFIFPKLMPIFKSLDIPLPLLTRVLMAVSEFLGTWWLQLLAVSGLIALGVTVARQSFASIRYVTDRLLIGLPLISRLITLHASTQFCRTLRLTLNAGMGLGDGLTITRDITRNSCYKNTYRLLVESVDRGERMSSTLFVYAHLFPDMLPDMIRTAEDSGSLSETLGYLGDFYEHEIDDVTKNLSNSIEPLLLIIMGLLVGLVAVSVITPLYEITRHMQRL